MALQGTIRDFGLPDILQLIGIQRKTGTLTLDGDGDCVTVNFLDGQVVGADTRGRGIEDLLGTVLVRTGRITEDQLRDALRIQGKTLQRLGYILVENGFLSQEDLTEALQIQVSQIVYRLFRWRSGTYHFDPSDTVEFDREHFNPISAETILMEGARMIDEWPLIERRIKSDRMVFRRTVAATPLLEEPVEPNDPLDGFDFDFGPGQGAGPTEDDGQPTNGEKKLKLSGEEREVLLLVDARSNVQEIVDRCTQGEFDTYRALHELLTKGLIEEVPAAAAEAVKTVRRAPRLVDRVLGGVVLLAALASLVALGSNRLVPWKIGGEATTTDRLRGYVSRVRLERVDAAIQVYYFDTGRLPSRLAQLVEGGYLGEPDMLDPWGRAYVYDVAEGGYRLTGLDATGAASEELVVRHQLSPTQLLVLDGGAATPD